MRVETSKLRRFSQFARRSLREQVSAKLQLVLAAGSPARRESPEAVAEIEKQIKHSSKADLVERVAYTWFNRFCALRFMDVNRYTPIGIVSPLPGQFQPEILAEAKMGHIDESMVPEARRRQVEALLNGTAPSRDPQGEAYRLLVVSVCNYYQGPMPYLFEKIADYTELLMPDDLLSGNSILAYTREAMTPDVCKDVEVLGWLYQFYVSERKDEVFESMRKGKKIAPEDVSATTQLFTPHWIVAFLLDNSLGRLWMLNRPRSRLIERMRYYLLPTQELLDFARVSSPEELRVGDSAVGAAHMLTYAFDLLYAIYEEEGYNPPDIPRLILEKNLYGMEIDERAAALAAFALTMKAREVDRRFLTRGVVPNICNLHSVGFTDRELVTISWLRRLGENLADLSARDALLHDLHSAKLLDAVGSLYRPQLTMSQIESIRKTIGAADDLFTNDFNQRVLDVLAQMECLARPHHVVATNPPYLGKGMNSELADFARSEYPDSKADTFAMFIERNLDFVMQGGLVAMVTMQSWMFLASFEKLRSKLLDNHTIVTMAHLGSRAFDSIGGEVVATTAFVLDRAYQPNFSGTFARLVDGDSESKKEAELDTIAGLPTAAQQSILYYASASDFKKIPGSPIAYWVSEMVRSAFGNLPSLDTIAEARAGLTTGDNLIFQRYWYEVAQIRMGIHTKSRQETFSETLRWYPCNSGGNFRKWFGNREAIVDWQNDGERIRSFADTSGRLKASPRSREYYFREGVSWSKIGSGRFSPRYTEPGFIFDDTGQSAFPQEGQSVLMLAGLLCSVTSDYFLSFLSHTLSFNKGDIERIPFPDSLEYDTEVASEAISVARADWDSYETSWDFTTLPLLRPEHRQATLAATYAHLRAYWQTMTDEMKRLEEENNRIFIDAYGLQDELTPDVLLHEITLTCNPHYRYGAGKTERDYEERLLADTIREFISYAVGCMFGRYSLDKPGLVLANAGEGVENYINKVAGGAVQDTISFMPDRDNVIPILDGEWFADDIVDRFKRFLRVTFGEEHNEENLEFIEKALGASLRSYFLREFYDDHVKRYQKRPIYWLFSSSNGSFNALIYMHRYRTDTVSVVLNEYLRDFQNKLAAHRSHLERVSVSAAAMPRDKTAALKEIDKVEKAIAELAEYEREVLYPLATQQVAIDLDDGVKVNYNKFGKALRKVKSLSV